MGKHLAETRNISNLLAESAARIIVLNTDDCDGVSTYGARCYLRVTHKGAHQGRREFDGSPRTWGRYRAA